MTLDLPDAAAVLLQVISPATGQTVKVLSEGSQQLAAGQYTLRLDLSGLPAGTYVVQCSAGGYRGSVKVVYLAG